MLRGLGRRSGGGSAGVKLTTGSVAALKCHNTNVNEIWVVVSDQSIQRVKVVIRFVPRHLDCVVSLKDSDADISGFELPFLLQTGLPWKRSERLSSSTLPQQAPVRLQVLPPVMRTRTIQTLPGFCLSSLRRVIGVNVAPESLVADSKKKHDMAQRFLRTALPLFSFAPSPPRPVSNSHSTFQLEIESTE